MTASRDGAGLTNGATRADQAGPVIAVVGPTGAGKSDLAVEIALELGGEIVNADSMQLYRGMDIGTAKIPMVERRGVPHHLLDVWEITRAADVASYQADARRVVSGLLAAGRVPILVGGSGLYVRAVLDDLSFPGTDPAVRARLERELAEVGPGPLHERLTGLAPTAAAAILPGNGRRIVRALEVVELTGTFEATLPGYRSIYDVVQVGVDRPDLDTRIADRVELMWRAGFVDEVAALAEAGLRDGRTASRALGYAQVLAVLDGAMDSMDAAKQATTTATRRFARRQRSWFRRDPRISWLEFPDVAAALAEVRRLVGSL
ncbi:MULTISPECIES: tRNA (adenosine(37)-N6)-dimethylallyltransferase MiaA [unclassified Parafrankia]|uniref:tRNA (adenosine(37)-N6)-dimethylallyltransferase MiaA n=1 Tax=unclassified Parafrankia TaxID=2994368 RepID=UPI000DA5DB33|nr:MULTISPECIES: tRNA (adenosine(37)-N6)-dimethylallyltransferase MiaA [unclassified Parafrankia]TCJ33165.1 tRNA (adenosine(37)-N6)-dimethylallyltransferase MiaA [Parafrankia sp. BMG5.11]SQD94250.1 tRNA dimethylallyltransferase [Parafrankia sp. Ea1.12]